MDLLQNTKNILDVEFLKLEIYKKLSFAVFEIVGEIGVALFF